MTNSINIQPLTRIEGHASISIHLDDTGNVSQARLHITSLRGFEKFVQGRPAEELPRIVNRICGICPWMHHIASVKAVDRCFSITPTTTGSKLREMALVLAHVSDKILHFFFLAAPDFILGPESDYAVRNIMGIAKAEPELANRVVRMRQLGQTMLERFAGKAIHPVAGVVGGFSTPLSEHLRQEMLKDSRTLLDFACYAFDFARERVFSRYEDLMQSLGAITTGFLGTVDDNGALSLYGGTLRLMRSDGSCTDFAATDYDRFLGEHVEPWSYSKMPYAKCWEEGFSLDPSAPKGIYRTNTLARLNVCDRISTPAAQERLLEFRERFGRPAQSTLLYHWARLIELIYACERTIELLEDPAITAPRVRRVAEVAAGRGIGHVEAPRGTLIHDYTTDDQGCITAANMIVGTTHNIAPMNLSVTRSATDLIKDGVYDQGVLNKVEMAVRAYDP